MEEKKYQIFVSSTFTDLAIARKKVIDMILSLYHFPVGMEMFSADDGEQWQTIEQGINFSDYYVVIIGHRYGALASDGFSYTEKEYDLAKENGVPILAFIRNRDIALKDDEREAGLEGQKKLESFIAKAKASKMCDFWGSHEELVGKVSVALHKIFHRNPRVGWIRSSSGVSKETTEELARLSIENRKLRERISYLEQDIALDRPKLIVKLIENDRILLSLQPHYNPVTIPNELSLSDVPDEYLEFVNQESIDKYNFSLPSTEKLKKYNEQASFYFRANNNSIQINPEIKNNGRMSASNVSVEVEFPDFVYICSGSEFNKLNAPANVLPVDPIKTARARKSFRDLRSGNISSMISHIDAIDSINNGLSPITGHANIQGINSWTKIQDGIVEFFEKKIMHTKTVSCDSLIIVPLKGGEGIIKINVICEEYKESTNFELPIIVS